MPKFFKLIYFTLVVLLLLQPTPAYMQGASPTFKKALSAGSYMGVLAWSKDGQHVWTTERINPNNTEVYIDTIRLFNVTTGAEVFNFEYEGSNTGVSAMLSQDEKRLLVWQGSNVEIHDALTGALLVTFPHTGWVYFAEWSPDESHILTFANQEGNVAHIWDANTGALLANMSHNRASEDLIRASWNADATLVATVFTQSPSEIVIWDNNGNLVFALPQSQEMTYEAFWSPNGNYLAVVRDTTVELWDVATQKLLNSLQVEGFVNMRAVWSPDGKWLAVTAGGQFALWDVAGSARITMEANTDFSVWFNHSATQLAVISDNTKLTVWSLDQTTITETYSASSEAFMYPALWSPDDRYLVYLTGDSMMHVVDAQTHTLLKSIHDPKILTLGMMTTTAQWNPTSTHISLFGEGANARVYNVTDGALSHTLSPDNQNGLSLAGRWSDNGKQFLLETMPADFSCSSGCNYDIAIWTID